MEHRAVITITEVRMSEQLRRMEAQFDMLVGGETAAGNFASVEAYQLKANSWSVNPYALIHDIALKAATRFGTTVNEFRLDGQTQPLMIGCEDCTARVLVNAAKEGRRELFGE